MAVRRTALTTRRPQSLFEDFDQIFRNFRTGLEDILWTPSLAQGLPRAMGGARLVPMDLRDTGDAFVIEAEMPGVPKDNLDIEVTEDGVQIQAQVRREQEEEAGDYYIRERAHSSWYRRVPFPVEVVPDQAEAQLRDGLLHLRVPKREPTPTRQGRKVKVK